MNNVIFLIFFIVITMFTQAQTRAGFSNSFKIEFVYGDEAHAREEILFEIKNNKVTGRITYPNTDKVIPSETELTDSQINVINSFAFLVNKYKNNDCKESHTSSYIKFYFIEKDNQTIKITKFCDWGRLTFFDIKRLIFENYLKSLEAKKQSINQGHFKILKGKWKESTPLDKLDLTSVCSLNKITKDLNTITYIEFTELNKVIIQRTDRKIYYNYRFEFRDDKTYIFLWGDDKKNREEFVYGHSFLIINWNNNHIKLSRGY